MPDERTIPSDTPKSVCTFKLFVDGNEVSRPYQVQSIVVNKEMNYIPSASIVFLIGDSAKESFEMVDQEDFEIGNRIEIKAGYNVQEDTLFKGIVIKQGIKFSKSDSVITLECKDEAVKMNITCKSKYFKEMKDSEIMEELIDEYGLEKSIEPTFPVHQKMVQFNATDWDFILSRADANALLCFPDNGKMCVVKPDFNAEPAMTMHSGANIFDFDAEVVDFEKERSMPLHSENLTEQELQQWIDAQMLRHKLAKVRGRVTMEGTSMVKPGHSIVINGIGEQFQDKLLVTGLRHQIVGGNWETTFRFGLNPEWFGQTCHSSQPQTGALLPAVQGLHIGVVTRLEGDPDGEDRIMVRLPAINKEDEGIWSRISTLDAGQTRGTIFRPEIGDEVIVGFLNDDPRFAVILGMCHSSYKPSPLPATDTNHKKGYVSRSDLKVIFDDDKRTINIETPAGNKFILSEDEKSIRMEDQHGNRFVMDQSGIELHSIRDIVMKAASMVKIEGVDVNIEGGQTKVEGIVHAEISSSGTTIVKGSMVQIN